MLLEVEDDTTGAGGAGDGLGGVATGVIDVAVGGEAGVTLGEGSGAGVEFGTKAFSVIKTIGGSYAPCFRPVQVAHSVFRAIALGGTSMSGKHIRSRYTLPLIVL